MSAEMPETGWINAAKPGQSRERVRRLGHLYVLATEWKGKGPASNAYDALLSYFDKHEPAVADAIRYGIVDTGVKMYGQDHGLPGHPQVMTFIKDKMTPQKWKTQSVPSVPTWQHSY